MEVIQSSVFLLVISQGTLAATSKVTFPAAAVAVRSEEEVLITTQSAMISPTLLHPVALLEMVVEPPGITVPSTKRNNSQHEDSIVLSSTVKSPVMLVSVEKPEKVFSAVLSSTVKSPVMLVSAEKPEKVFNAVLFCSVKSLPMLVSNEKVGKLVKEAFPSPKPSPILRLPVMVSNTSKPETLVSLALFRSVKVASNAHERRKGRYGRQLGIIRNIETPTGRERRKGR